MTAYDRECILSIIAGRIRENGSMKLNQLTRVLEEHGFTREIYEGKDVKRWLLENVPQVQVQGSCGRELLLMNIPAPEKEKGEET